MKKVICLILLFVCLFIFCSCGRNDIGHSYHISENINLTLVARKEHFSIYVHNETRVMYIVMEATDAKYSGGISVMFDECGNPLIYEGYINER